MEHVWDEYSLIEEIQASQEWDKSFDFFLGYHIATKSVLLIYSGSFQIAAINRGIQEYRSKTCVRFQPRNGERDYVLFIRGRG